MATNNIDVVLRLLNGRRFQAEMRNAGRATSAVGADFKSAAASASGLSQAGHAAAGSMRALGAASRVAGYGVGAIGTGVTAMGIGFQSTMESNSLTFEKFTDSAKDARKFSQKLFEMAAETPFAFEDITTAGRRLLAFGFDVEQTEVLLRTLGDTLAYTGGGSDEIYRISKAFGDINAKGRLMQQELNQLANVGIPIIPLLREELDLSEKQLRNIGRAGISSEEALGGMVNALSEFYKGGAKKYMNTFAGQWQRLKDNISLASGVATGFNEKTGKTGGLFSILSGALRGLNDGFEKFNAFLASEKFRGAMSDIGKFLAAAFEVAKDVFHDFFDALKPMKPFWDNVLGPFLKGLAIGIGATLFIAFKIGTLAIRLFATVLGWLGEKLAFLKPVFEFLGQVVAFVFGGAILKAIGWLTKFGGVFAIVGGIARVLATPVSLVGKLFIWLGGLFGRIIGFVGRLIPGMGKLTGAFKSVGNFIKNAFGSAFLWVLSRLGNFGNKIFDFAMKIGPLFVKGLGNIGKAILGAFGSAIAFFGTIGRGIADWLNKETILGDRVNLPGFLPDFNMPALAGGGYLTSGGYALVGEQGPEVVRMPTGASVIPNKAAKARPLSSGSAGGPQGATFDGLVVNARMPIYIDRRQVGEAMGEFVAERQARR